MRRLLISFLFTLLSAQTAYAFESQADHAVKLLKTFEADKVDNVINESVGKVKCGAGTNSVVKSESTLSDNQSIQGPGRSPAIEGNGVSKFELFKKKVAKGEFRDSFFGGKGDVYYYSSEKEEQVKTLGLNMEVRNTEFAFYRQSASESEPMFHELGLSEDEVKNALLKLLDKSDETFQIDESSFAFRVGEKAYMIDLKQPLLANPIYKQDVRTARIEYGLNTVLPRTIENDKTNFVSQIE